MIAIKNSPVIFRDGKFIEAMPTQALNGRKHTMSYPIFRAHNTVEGMDSLKLRFDAMASHDIT